MPRALGKLAARNDPRVPKMHEALPALPAPPDSANWMADVPEWLCLGNDVAGCCTYSAAGHYILQQSCYVNPGAGLKPTAAETLQNYAVGTGYNPNNPVTDQGQFMMGQGGLIQQWATKGLLCGGVVNKIQGAVSINPHDTIRLRQAISMFGAVLVGIQLPKNIYDMDILPYVWDDVSGPSVGGHEILIPAYLTTPGGTRMYHIISWGADYRIPEPALMQIIDEAIAVYDPVGMDARGVNAGGISVAGLQQAVQNLA